MGKRYMAIREVSATLNQSAIGLFFEVGMLLLFFLNEEREGGVGSFNFRSGDPSSCLLESLESEGLLNPISLSLSLFILEKRGLSAPHSLMTAFRVINREPCQDVEKW